MLNPSFPKSAMTFDVRAYVAPEEITKSTVHGNMEFDAGEELRLQDVYTEEIWLKMADAGIGCREFRSLSVLEVCGGGGFLTYHLLKKCCPKDLTVNDISESELSRSRRLIGTLFPEAPVRYVSGDMHEVELSGKFDLVIGNSFLHHFHDVPRALARFRALLQDGGRFIALHEPTPMATVLEGAKTMAYPLAVAAPELVNDIARARYHGPPSATDIWLFEPRALEGIAKQAGFKSVESRNWHLLRPYVVQKMGLHLHSAKSALSQHEERKLRAAIRADSMLRRILPARFWGSVCLVCRN